MTRTATSKINRNKRYYLHQKVKGICNIETTQRAIFCKESDIDNLKSNKYIASLINNIAAKLELDEREA